MRASEEGGGCFPTGRHYPGIAHLLRIVAQGLIDEIDAGTLVGDLSFVAIDTETTGMDPAVDRIVEVACVVFRGADVVARHRWLVNPGVPISKEAFDVHGISDDHVRDQPTFAAISDELIGVLRGHVPLAYNAEFDRAFIAEELGRAGIANPSLPPAIRRSVHWADPLVWARELQKEEKSKSLSEVAERLGVKLERAHSALDDAEAAVRVLAAFCGDTRVPKTYGAFMQEQRRLGRLHDEDRQYWRKA
ncbi:MAG TPA: 3'-5' exonuclease [Polyangiaceae bacterium]|jgi:DNA polymerase-3 subunit epsilon|nr:3'-5' exonuclease [Polyangiaceae bacterium]